MFRSISPTRSLTYNIATDTALQALGALLLLGFLMSALGQSIPFLSDLTQSEAPASASPSSGPQLYSYDIIETYPHDPNAFTQGLDYDKVDGADAFWESTGAHPFTQSILYRISCGMAICTGEMINSS